MGIKFRGKQSTGNPAGGAIKERELEINLADKTLFTSSDGADIIQLGKDIAGRLWDTTNSYKLGDMVITAPGGFIHHAVINNTAVDPATDNGTNWTQPAVVIPVYEYNFLSTVTTGTVPPALPVAPPAAGHTHEHDGLTGIPNELGAYYFSIEAGSTLKTAEVYVDGFKLPSTEYDLSNDGYVYILSPVADNSWVQITI